MTLRHATIAALAVAIVAATPLQAIAAGPTVVTPAADLKWKDLGNGIQAAPVSGDMAKGASRFYLKYPVGLVTPKHHHSADHYATVVSGTVTLTVNGKEYKLGPGSYFALTKKAPHVAKVEGNQEVVFFIQADSPWNVVMDK
jgi:quercetin dioxygenase-like cupin family protein